MRRCNVNFCGRSVGKHGAKGMCPKHYKRYLKHGDPMYKANDIEKQCKDCDKKYHKRSANQVRCFDCQKKYAREIQSKWMEKYLQQERFNRKCLNCDVLFKSKNKRKYCSRKCNYRMSKITRKGSGNPAYKDGDSCKYIEMSKKLHNEIDCCEICGKYGGLDMHHLVYRSEAPRHKNLHNEANLIMLCRGCHMYLHNKKSRRKKYIIKRELWKIFPELLYLKEELKAKHLKNL